MDDPRAVALMDGHDYAPCAGLMICRRCGMRSDPVTSKPCAVRMEELLAAVRGALAPVPQDFRFVAEHWLAFIDEHPHPSGNDEAMKVALRALLALPPAPAASPDGPCAFCGDPTDHLAGNPGLWPLHFAHPDGTGEVKAHHVKCVTERALPAVRGVARVTATVRSINVLDNRVDLDGKVPLWPGAKVGDEVDVVASAKEKSDGK